MTEADFIALLRASATHPAARELRDDAALLEVGGATLALTHDMIVEGVHFFAGDPPADVAWKLLAVNLSDLAAKGATPLGVLLGYCLGEDGWDREFVAGLRAALNVFAIPLLGGDTVAVPDGAPRALGLTAVGRATGPAPSRGGARPGHHLWVTGSIGDSGAGLRALLDAKAGAGNGSAALIERYRNPRPRLDAGRALAPIVDAMMDVSDGLLIDSARMSEASNVALIVDLAAIPLSPEYIEAVGEGRGARLAAATAGDDYELLFAAPPQSAAALLALAKDLELAFTRIGTFEVGAGIRLTEGGEELQLPHRLGYEHS